MPSPDRLPEQLQTERPLIGAARPRDGAAMHAAVAGPPALPPAEQAGFEREGVLRNERCTPQGRLRDTRLCARTPDRATPP